MLKLFLSSPQSVTDMYKVRKIVLLSISPISVGSHLIPVILEMKCVRLQLTSKKLLLRILSLSVHHKYGQKRPESSPVPSSHHHHNQPQIGGQTTVMPAHMNPQNMQQMHQQAQQKSHNNSQSAANSRNSEQSFAAALRSLAKQQVDIKDEDMIQQGGENKSSSNPRTSEKELEASRQASASRGIQYDNRPTDMRNLTSPQPPEKKVCRVGLQVESKFT